MLDLKALLGESNGDDFYLQESLVEQYRCDFYIPNARLVIEINGKEHFYPYTYKKNQFTLVKTKMLRGNGQC